MISDEKDRSIRKGLSWPGWYLLLRTPRGFERVRAKPLPDFESTDESSMISVPVDAFEVRRDQLVGPFPVVCGGFHAVLYPDPEDRGQPLPGPTAPDDSLPPAA